MRLVEPGHFSANVSRARRRCCARACPSQPRSHSKPSRLSFSVMALAAALGARIEAGYVRKVLGTAGTPLHLDEIEAAHERRDDVRSRRFAFALRCHVLHIGKGVAPGSIADPRVPRPLARRIVVGYGWGATARQRSASGPPAESQLTI